EGAPLPLPAHVEGRNAGLSATAPQVSEISRYSLLTAGAGMPAGASKPGGRRLVAAAGCGNCDRSAGLRREFALVRPPRYLLPNGLHLNLRKGSPCDPNF